MKKSEAPTPVATLAHRFQNYGASVADLAAQLVAEFDLLRSAAAELQAATPGYKTDLYKESALVDLMAYEWQRLNAVWAGRHPMGNHSIKPFAKQIADIADCIVDRKAA
jgi:hypothetical protein